MSQKKPLSLSQRKVLKTYLLVVSSLTVLCLVWFIPSIPQDPAYHNFADQRAFWGIPNCLDVLSNWIFVAVGLTGFLVWQKHEKKANKVSTDFQKRAYFIVFTGIAAIGFGSAYYHWQPSNGTLLWDRLPMAVVFMGLLGICLAERVHLQMGRILFVPLLVLGIFSVLYWSYTEEIGRGDLRLYGVVQFYTLVFIPMIVMLFEHPNPKQRQAFLKMALFYALAKVSEHYDAAIFEFGHIVGGHALKHIWAGVATYFLVEAYENRV